MRFKIEDLLDMAVSQNYGEVMMKYKLSIEDMRIIENALRKSEWKVID